MELEAVASCKLNIVNFSQEVLLFLIMSQVLKDEKKRHLIFLTLIPEAWSDWLILNSIFFNKFVSNTVEITI